MGLCSIVAVVIILLVEVLVFYCLHFVNTYDPKRAREFEKFKFTLYFLLYYTKRYFCLYFIDTFSKYKYPLVTKMEILVVFYF